MVKKYLIKNRLKLIYVTSVQVQRLFGDLGAGRYKNISFATSLDRLHTDQIARADILVIDLASLESDALAAISRIKKHNAHVKVYASHDSLHTLKKVSEYDFNLTLLTLTGLA